MLALMGSIERAIPGKADIQNEILASERRRSLEKLISETPHMFLKNKEKVVAMLSSLIESYELAGALNELADRHKESSDHSMRMAAVMADIAIERGEQNIPNIALGAMLHDIGKLDIPLSVLAKEENFNDEDRSVMKEHVVKSMERFLNDARLSRAAQVPLVKEISFGHHLRRKVDPYPSLSAGEHYGIEPAEWDETTNRVVDIAAIADVYESVAIGRKYNEAKIDEKVNPELVFNIISKTENVPDDLIAMVMERFSERAATA